MALFQRTPSPIEKAENAVAQCQARLAELRQQRNQALALAAENGDLAEVQRLDAEIVATAAEERTWLDVCTAARKSAEQAASAEVAKRRQREDARLAKALLNLDRRGEALTTAGDSFFKIQVQNYIDEAARLAKLVLPAASATRHHFEREGVMRLVGLEMHRLATAAGLHGFPVDPEALTGGYDYQHHEYRTLRAHVELLGKYLREAVADAGADDLDRLPKP